MPIQNRTHIVTAIFTIAMIAIAAPACAQVSNSLWLDLTPMTRNILGAETELSTDFSVGWSTGEGIVGKGWRVLGGYTASSDENDNFGTSIETTLFDIDFRAGRRWSTGALTSPDERWQAGWGVDLICGLDHLDTRTLATSFEATNSTDMYRIGTGAVATAAYQLSSNFNLAIEGRFDAWYVYDKTVVDDNFSEPNTSVDEGWASSLTPPVQLFLCYQFASK